jgi:leader peptidase (prepilin peptidase) / N-methyltransferase
MSWLRVLVAFPTGLIFGSYLTVVVHRVPRGESLVRPRSRCPFCGTQVRSVDNIPVVSWLILRGRCHACGERISPVYPLLELASGALFVGAALRFADPFVAALIAPFTAVLVAIAVIDVRTKKIPNRIVYPCLVIFPTLIVAGAALGGRIDVLRAGLGFLIYGGAFLVLAFISPRGMGMGDVKLAALIGLVLGSAGLAYVATAAALAIFLGGAGAVVALFRGLGRKGAIPFGPFLAAGAVAAAFLGEEIARAYLGRLG